jgi:hypothetical protein
MGRMTVGDLRARFHVVESLSWSGGILGVMKGQMADMNEALKTWLGTAAKV